MQGIYTYIPETNYVPREYSVAAILLLLLMVLLSLVSVLNLLYFYISTFRNMCAVPNMAVVCSSLPSCFPGMLLTYFLNYYYYYYYYATETMQHGGYSDGDLFIYILFLVYQTISVAQTRKHRRAE